MQKKILNFIQSPTMYKFQQHLSGSDELHNYSIAEEVNLNDLKNVLDIGCGIGNDSKLFNNKTTSYLGIDIDQKRIDFANQFYSNENVSFENTSINELKINQAFDLVLIFGVFHHLTDEEIENFVENIKLNSRYFKKIIILDPVKVHNQGVLATLFQILDVGANIKDENGYLKFFETLNFSSSIVYPSKFSFIPILKTVIDIEPQQP